MSKPEENQEDPTIENSLPKENQPSPEPEKEEKPEQGAADPFLEKKAVEVDVFADIAGSLLDAKPEPQEHFVKAIKDRRTIENDKKEVEANGQDWRFLKDKDGRYWNADICENKADPKTGLPIKTASGLWKLKRSAKSADRKKLSKRPPNIEAKVAAADEAAQAQAEAEAQAASIQQSAIMTTKAILAGHRAIMSQVSTEKAVKEVLGYEIGEGQFKVKVSDIMESAGVEMMVQRGGGVSLPPWAIFAGSLVLSSGAIILHPSKPERRENLKEWLGLKVYRLRGLFGRKAAKQESREVKK